MKAYHQRAGSVVLSGIAAISLLAYPVHANAKGYGKGAMKPSQQQQQQQQQAPANPPPVDSGTTSQAQDNLIKARQTEQQAEENLNTVTNKLRADFNNSPDMTAANSELKDAKDAYEKASKPIVEKIHDSDEYKTAQTAHDQDEEKLTALRASNGSPDTISSLAMDALAQASTMTKVENAALASDPTASAAKGKMSQAGAKIAKLQANFNASLTQNAEWSAAKKALDDARQNLETASGSQRNAGNNQAAPNATAAK